MTSAVGIAGLLVVVSLSILVTRIATIALTHTGLARESARFQARSAFTGSGFTTDESERVVNHPVRRRIILLLMLLGNAGIVTSIASLLVTFISPDSSTASTTVKIAFLVTGVSLLWLVSYSQFVDRWLSRLIEWALGRLTDVQTTDFAGLLRLRGDYTVSELAVREGDWISNKSLADSKLRDEGVMVLGVQRKDGAYVGVPDGDTKILPGDMLVIYGRAQRISELDQRELGTHGDAAHEEAVADARETQEEEKPVSDPDQEKSGSSEKSS